MPKHGRIDENQPDLVAFARSLGMSVAIVAGIPGQLDLIVGIAGIDQRVEVKNPEKPLSDRKLTQSEQKVFSTWNGRKPIIWETEDDALSTFETLRREAENARLKATLAPVSKSQEKRLKIQLGEHPIG